MKKIKLHWQIIICMIVGTFIGLYFNHNGFANNIFYNFLTLLADIFIRLLKMVIVPLIFTSIIIGVSSINNKAKIGRLGGKTLLYYICTSLVAILIGLSLANIIEPGAGASTIKDVGAFDTSKLNTSSSVVDILKRMIPLNPISALASGDILGIIFFAIFFGIMLSFVESKHSSNIKQLIESIYQVIMKMTQLVIACAPIGVLGLMVRTVSNTGLSVFKELSLYAMTIAAGLSIHLFLVIPIILILFVKVNPVRHFRAMAPAMVTAFSTSSSSATLPVTMKCVNENVKASNEVTSFVIPMGATINMDGTALYECAGVLFIAQALGIPLDASQQFIVVITALLASIGAAGIPSAGLVMLFIVTDAVGLQSDAVALWVGSMLAIDRPLDMFRTMVNISSDSVGAAVIAKSEGESLY
ncbi:MAG: dicarboxylate/amino acid:cation symporter [Candidatus Marinimicrobia bacterium]|nr:dicarboxylate/amino acid:cation symporter [Candidatus Neomarinimicrobiota bacterium]|tara:strand:+ start:2727 stop:3968 length:1242 start_codon:yes stop_codon:yes gene_type:complete